MVTADIPDAGQPATASQAAVPPSPSDSAANVFTLLFAAAIYLAVWIILIYIVCFVGNYFHLLFSPQWQALLPLKTIDSGIAEPAGKALFIDILLIIILGLQHSIMPRPWFKEFITKIVPPHLERDTYIIFAMAALWLLMWQWRPLPEPIWQVSSPVWRKILDLIQLGGWLTVLIATFQVGHWKIFGVTQALDYIQGRPYTKVHGHRLPNEFFEVGWPVTDKGLWYFARHPDFFGFCTAFWVTPTMTVGHLVFAIGLTIYIMFGIFFLETNLSQLYGRSYDQYVQIRSKIIPWFVPNRRGRLLFRILTAILFLIALVALIAAAAILLLGDNTRQAGKVKDEAMLAGRDVASFPAAAEDYFAAMDGGEKLTPDQVKGRNMWIVWTGGNDRLWDKFVDNSYGAFDLLKTISSYPTFKYSRDNRWNYLGVVNEPCFDKATGPDPDHFGLWLDKRRADCPADDFADAKKYPGVKIGARGDGTLPVGSYYGEPTGIVGLRLFPNPAFDEAARKAWDPERYYTDPSYYQRKDLIRPYRVGMACGFCHVGPNPTHPPADPEHPQWQDLKSAVGAQYFWFDRIFVWSGDESNAILQLLHADKPGALDTSLASSDNIVNPRTMNAVYNLGARLNLARRFDPELLTDGELDNKQFNDFPNAGDLRGLYQRPYVWPPRVLKDGSDSVGGLGALNRVYINIGLFSEEWLLHFFPFIALKRITPIPIATAERNSVYWRATEQQTWYMAQFLLAVDKPDLLADAPGGKQFLTADAAILDRGKTLFAERCARCHSSKLPDQLEGMNGSASCAGANYLDCWNTYWKWTKTDDFKQRMVAIVKQPDFLKDNYLSTDLRVPVTLLQTNACSPLATNALAGDIWDNFSSQSYKRLPAVGDITVKDPFTGADRQYRMPGGGRGYTRPASLVSLWSTAPFLLNNSVGEFDPDPSVAARMGSFDKSIRQMLWPATREHDKLLPNLGAVDRTVAPSWLKLPRGYLPDGLARHRGLINWLIPGAMNEAGDVMIGPVPAGTPIGLLGSFNPLPERPGLWSTLTRGWDLLKLGYRYRHYVATLPPGAGNDVMQREFEPVARALYAMSKCPDYEVNRGHYFGTDRFAEEPGLSDADKNALIAFLKTF